MTSGFARSAIVFLQDGKSISKETTRDIMFLPARPRPVRPILAIGSCAKFLRRFIKKSTMKRKANSLSPSPEESRLQESGGPRRITPHARGGLLVEGCAWYEA